jgi:hypothetical protein
MPFLGAMPRRATLEDSGLPSFVAELDRVFEHKDYASALNAMWKSKPPGIDFKVGAVVSESGLLPLVMRPSRRPFPSPTFHVPRLALRAAT